MVRFYVMSQHTLRRLSDSDRFCCRCDKPIHIGEDVVSKTNGHSARRYYHISCWNAMFLDV